MFMVNLLLVIVPILLAMAFLTLIKQKVLGYMQFHKGPNIVGPYGLLQPIAEAMKLFTKEPLRPLTSLIFMFIIAPVPALTLALTMWTPLSMPHPLINMNLGILFMLAMSSLAMYSILWSGWSSNSKYALIGALQAVAQTISYEVTLAIILLSVLLLSEPFSLSTRITTQEHTWLTFPSWPALISSEDILHSWAVPSLGLKTDVIPGLLNQTTLLSTQPGLYYNQCSEICGSKHSFMPIVL